MVFASNFAKGIVSTSSKSFSQDKIKRQGKKIVKFICSVLCSKAIYYSSL
jgi:hypothetical protein